MATYAGSTSPDAFPAAAAYANLIAPSHAVREPQARPTPFPWTERHLQCVWFDPALRPPNLRTREGEPAFVDFAGIWNLEAGPDFLGAALRVGKAARRIEGDVEVHIRPRDWRAHRHAEDPRDRRVRVHVTYFPGWREDDPFPAGTVQIALRDPLLANPYFSFDAVDLTAYPYAARQPGAPCSEILAAWTAEEKAALLTAAGHERLRRKSERLANAIQEKGPDQVLYEELLAALGYKQNKAACRLLAERLPVETLRREARGDAVAAYALLLGVADLLPPALRTAWDDETRAFVRRLWDIWWKRRAKYDHWLLSRSRWTLASVRPANHPARRLMAAAWCFTRTRPLAESLRELASSHPAAFAARAARLLEPPASTYWHHRVSWGGKRLARPLRLLGAQRFGALLANVVAPFLAAQGCAQPLRLGLLDFAPAEGEHAIVRQTAFTLFGPDHTALLYRSGLRRQGLVQIFHDFCLNDRSRCCACPLPAALSRFRPPCFPGGSPW